jgi:hypothetical protein
MSAHCCAHPDRCIISHRPGTLSLMWTLVYGHVQDLVQPTPFLSGLHCACGCSIAPFCVPLTFGSCERCIRCDYMHVQLPTCNCHLTCHTNAHFDDGRRPAIVHRWECRTAKQPHTLQMLQSDGVPGTLNSNSQHHA